MSSGRLIPTRDYLLPANRAEARPAGEWNQVREEYVKKTDARGRPFVEMTWFCNGEKLTSVSCALDQGSIGVNTEVIEGQFRFDKVMIRAMPR